MSTFELNILEVDTTNYDLELVYNKRHYKKAITSESIDTFQPIIKQYPNILKDALTKNKDNKDYFTIKEKINECYGEPGAEGIVTDEINITFVIDLQFTKETVSLNLDEVSELNYDVDTNNSRKIVKLENTIKQLMERLDLVEDKAIAKDFIPSNTIITRLPRFGINDVYTKTETKLQLVSISPLLGYITFQDYLRDKYEKLYYKGSPKYSLHFTQNHPNENQLQINFKFLEEFHIWTAEYVQSILKLPDSQIVKFNGNIHGNLCAIRYNMLLENFLNWASLTGSHVVSFELGAGVSAFFDHKQEYCLKNIKFVHDTFRKPSTYKIEHNIINENDEYSKYIVTNLLRNEKIIYTCNNFKRGLTKIENSANVVVTNENRQNL
jgi:hypothetical protein